LINFRRWWSREGRSMRRRMYEKEERKERRRKEKTRLCYLHRLFSLD
jgi:hypothetical protein